MKFREVVKSPQWAKVSYLMELSDLGGGMPGDPHARENFKYAAGLLAIGHHSAEEFLRLCLGQYVGSKYRDAVEKDVRRIAQAAAREPVGDG